jgi:gas vesicle protein
MSNEYEEQEEQSGGGYLRGLVTGVLLGAATMLLLAPKRGDEMRQDLVEGAGRFREKADELKGRTEGLGARVNETAQELKERGQQLVECAKERGASVLGHVQHEDGECGCEATEEIGGAEAAVEEAADDMAHDVVKSV